MNRRTFLASTAAVAVLPLASCDSNTTIAAIIASLQTTCGFLTTADQVIAVVLTIVSNFNAAAGAAASVTVTVANQVIDLICTAVAKQGQAASASLRAANAGASVTVLVNGVPVTGKIVGSK